MRIARFDKEVLDIAIRNQHPDLELTSPVYCGSNTVLHVSPSQQTDTNDTMKASFGVAFKQEVFEGTLLYKLQRRHANETDNQPSSSTACIKDATTDMYLLVAWNVRDHNHIFCACLIECTADFVWNEDRLWALYSQHSNQIYRNYKYDGITWLMYDGEVMRTRLGVTYGSGYKLDVNISEAIPNYYAEKPMKINPKRSVLLLSIMIMLTYAISLSIQPSVKLNIHNQFPNVDLVSPMYVTCEESEFHRRPSIKYILVT
jgi:hypothetical protein